MNQKAFFITIVHHRGRLPWLSSCHPERSEGSRSYFVQNYHAFPHHDKWIQLSGCKLCAGLWCQVLQVELTCNTWHLTG